MCISALSELKSKYFNSFGLVNILIGQYKKFFF